MTDSELLELKERLKKAEMYQIQLKTLKEIYYMLYKDGLASDELVSPTMKYVRSKIGLIQKHFDKI